MSRETERRILMTIGLAAYTNGLSRSALHQLLERCTQQCGECFDHEALVHRWHDERVLVYDGVYRVDPKILQGLNDAGTQPFLSEGELFELEHGNPTGMWW